MPRRAKLILPDTAHHIVQRSLNRIAVFSCSSDFQYYLNTLREWKRRLDVQVYGYCIMTNHIHLILNPGENESSIGNLMKRLAGRQTCYFNFTNNHTGAIWEGRYKSSPIETETYLLACARYVDLNPVRAGIVAHPKDYIWSSYRQKAGLKKPWVDFDPCYLGLSDHLLDCQKRYADYVAGEVPNQEVALIRNAIARGKLTGRKRSINHLGTE